jgi:hypothetical protein
MLDKLAEYYGIMVRPLAKEDKPPLQVQAVDFQTNLVL